jgi:hypothetical protein
MTADIKTLYSLVTDAIRKAEVLEELSAPGRRDAWLDVSLLEERIASLLPASSNEGAIARRGAVSAAVDAGAVERAEQLVARFFTEAEADDALKRDLWDLKEEAVSLTAGWEPVPVAAHNLTVKVVAFKEDGSISPTFGRVARRTDGPAKARVIAQVVSSLAEARTFILASGDIASVHIEVDLRADNPADIRNAFDKLFPAAAQRRV